MCALLVRVQRFANSPLETHLVILSTLKPFNYMYFRAGRYEIRCAIELLVCRLDHRRRLGKKFLQKHILELILHQTGHNFSGLPNKELSKNILKPHDISNHASIVLK